MNTFEAPTVSVIIPCYNAEKFVEDAVLSALNQTYPVEQVICIDDGSTDNTERILNRLSEKHSSVAALSQDNQGPGSARNKGMQRCTSEYVQFLDADDILLPEKIEHQISMIANNDDPLDIIIGSYTLYDVYTEKYQDVVINVGSIWINFIDIKLGTMCSNLFKRSALEDVGLFNTGTHVEDTDLYFRLLKQTPSYAVDASPLTIIRRHGDCRSKKREPLQKSKIKLLGEVKSYLRKNNLLDRKLRDIIDEDILDRARDLYPYDSAASCELHDRHISSDFNVWVSDSQPRTYLLLYSLFGFRIANILFPYTRVFTGYIKKIYPGSR